MKCRSRHRVAVVNRGAALTHSRAVTTHLGGRLVLFLHAHLPYVRHPNRRDVLEEDWLYEAITDVYLPLCRLFDGWYREGVDVRLAMSVSPPLVEMLQDELLLDRYQERLRRLVELAGLEVQRTRGTDCWPLATRYYERLTRTAEDFAVTYGRDLVGAFGRFARRGQLELATSAATHAYLPLHGVHPSFLRAQIRTGVRAHRRAFGLDPAGFWLPECGYEPGLDDYLAEEGIRYFVMDTHGVTNADPPPVLRHYAPVVCPSGVMAFPRDPASSERVWSAKRGYPSDPRYRERYRDVGFELPPEALNGLVLSDGARRAVGIKYHRVTGLDVPLEDKARYDPELAEDAVEAHAEDFVAGRIADASRIAQQRARGAVIVAPYDAELFGHWWYEGPAFLDRVVRKVASRRGLQLATPTDVIDGGERFQLVAPAHSSWGAGGYASTWLNAATDWILPELHAATIRMRRLADRHARAEGLQRRALTQAARELLLASASDWPFILTHRTVVSYAEQRVRDHLARFDRLHDALASDRIDLELLESLESEDAAFRDLDPRDFCS